MVALVRAVLAHLPEQIGELKELRQLDLRGNPLTRLPDGLAQLPRLEKLDLRWVETLGLPVWVERLEELIRIGDYITVLRDGRITGQEEMRNVDTQWIVRQMIGSDAKDFAKAIAGME